MKAPTSTQEFTPDWSVHPGVVLRQVLEQRSIRQSELAERAGLTAKHVNQIVNQVVGISGDVAVVLERALDIPAQFWTRLDADYTTYTSKQKAREKLLEFSEWADSFDSATLRHYNITTAKDDRVTRTEKILKFFGVANPEAFEQTWIQPRVSFRRSQAFTVAEQNTALWLRLVDLSAQRINVGPLRARILRKIVRTLPAMTNLSVADGFLAARAALAEAGVVLVFVREVPGTRVCAATWWLSADRPVIGITERHRKPDIFWFNLVHEIGHILLHPKRTTFLDLDIDKEHKDAAEVEADDFAENSLLSKEDMTRISRANTRQDLALLAARLGVGATIVAGKHGHITGNWKIGAPLRGKITDADMDAIERLQESVD